jgi:ribulose-bisphosphate carboxylase large chain
VLARFRGPRFGIRGLRMLCGDDAVGRPLLCGALKPLGFSPAALADLAYRLARGGVDIVKDDHGLADQSPAPFDRRIEACQGAVQRANSETGGATLYFPHVTGGPERLELQLDRARGLGCRGVLISPMLVGLETIRQIAERHTLALVAHPSMTGAFFGSGHGLAPDLLLGQIFRLAGHDAVIYPNVGGRFPLDAPVCEAINDRLRRPWNEILPAFPVPGGGIDVARMPHWIDRYGPDTIFLIGGSLYAEPDLEAGTRKLAEVLRSG